MDRIISETDLIKKDDYPFRGWANLFNELMSENIGSMIIKIYSSQPFQKRIKYRCAIHITFTLPHEKKSLFEIILAIDEPFNSYWAKDTKHLKGSRKKTCFKKLEIPPSEFIQQKMDENKIKYDIQSPIIEILLDPTCLEKLDLSWNIIL